MKEKQVGGGQMADYYLSELQREVAATDIRHGGQLGCWKSERANK